MRSIVMGERSLRQRRLNSRNRPPPASRLEMGVVGQFELSRRALAWRRATRLRCFTRPSGLNDQGTLLNNRIRVEAQVNRHNNYHKIAMVIWTYRCYDDGNKPNLWQRWYDSNPNYQGKHDSVFRIIEHHDQWREPYTKILKDGLVEVRITGDVQWRIFGFFSKTRREFIVVSTGYHKGQIYDPRNIIKKSIVIKNDIKSGIKKAISCGRPQ